MKSRTATVAGATVVGAGLAGCEAAYQLAKRGIDVMLYESKPHYTSDAHSSDMFAELVCSNSLRADGLGNAVGLLKQEMRDIGSLIMQAADATKVAAGGALAVDRHQFSKYITDAITNNEHITVVRREVTTIPDDDFVIIAAGPLVSTPLANDISNNVGLLSFFDAAAPIVTAESVDMDTAFFASRYDKGSDYINCAMDETQYHKFYEALINAETAKMHGFEDSKVFEGCMPVETMAKRGYQTLCYGPLKPKGLNYPGTDKMPYAVVQLRREDSEGRLFNLVGFQTHLKFGEQKRVFSMIPGLEHAEFVRYGVMHKNTYIHSPSILTEHYESKARKGLFFAGQITGVEGYIESASSGMLAGIFAGHDILETTPPTFSADTACGALAKYVSGYVGADFQPMNVNFGIMNAINMRAPKRERKQAISKRALEEIAQITNGGIEK
ncbi:MAG: methylenetetrahydrofolate--tRNA-(uracil(54)-C(5))-methyltransferase (FADH(2)-oxidizing) TrmFO [Clostridia bacterium]|jgi:methylenetetrahydrofolate--tRNA-(uracil-5-)-methyltransferase|nr:methylenetetrahydrofolate--tRNA-(uracil(54)-C(5))-methyltransferase (FADH(2)-oxidizing) TrmFO [Clostridia bacterium]MBT7122305.1 methylenetetrahydrofolate--tRNA-(uracil(54)-C(5))-methyltransferase (FADH(2)-oxidizing) TrmFO [Clostridia bacterium]